MADEIIFLEKSRNLNLFSNAFIRNSKKSFKETNGPFSSQTGVNINIQNFETLEINQLFIFSSDDVLGLKLNSLSTKSNVLLKNFTCVNNRISSSDLIPSWNCFFFSLETAVFLKDSLSSLMKMKATVETTA